MPKANRNLPGFGTLIDRKITLDHPDVLNNEPFFIDGLGVFMIRETLEVKRRWWERLFSNWDNKTKEVVSPQWVDLKQGTVYFDDGRIFCSPKTFVRIKATMIEGRKHK